MREDWVEVELGVVCSYSKGKKPKVLSRNYSEKTPFPYINIKAFEYGIIEEFTDGEKCNLCEDGDLLMVWDGARAGLTGTAQKGAVGSTLMKIEHQKEIQKNYLNYFLQSLFTKLNTNPRGVGIPHVEPTLLWSSKLLVHSQPEQRAIVRKIETLFASLDKGISDLKTAQQQLKIYRQAVLKKAFEGRLTNKDVKEGELPKGWKTSKFSEITKNFDFKRKPLSNSYRKTFKGPYPYYGACEVIDYVEDYLFDGEYLLIGEDGANLLSKSKPLSFIVKGKFWVNNHAHIVQPEVSVDINFLNYQFNNLHINEYVTGTAQPKLNQLNLNKIPIILPPTLAEQQSIVREIESRLSVCDKIEQSISEALEKAEALRQSILKIAFDGRLLSEEEIAACKREPDYEPAAVLLERIKKEKHGK